MKVCPICGAEFVVESPKIRKIYCSKKCNNRAVRQRKKEARLIETGGKNRPEKKRKTDYPIKYSPKQAQASHDRQADIERRARAAGMSYGKYQMMKYMERMEAKA